MSKRNKLQKFTEVLTFANVYECFDPRAPQLQGINGLPVAMKGEWAKKHFDNDAPITLELACGRGEYTLDLARRYPDRSFIGVDVKGARIWKGAKIALAEQLDNAVFLRTRIEEIPFFFEPREVAEIWITFPDPFLKKSKANRRLTAHRFLDQYKKVLVPEGVLHLKTDETQLFEFSLESLSTYPGAEILYVDDDIYAKPLPFPELETKTYYEKMHLAKGKTIKYVQFKLGW